MKFIVLSSKCQWLVLSVSYFEWFFLKLKTLNCAIKCQCKQPTIDSQFVVYYWFILIAIRVPFFFLYFHFQYQCWFYCTMAQSNERIRGHYRHQKYNMFGVWCTINEIIITSKRCVFLPCTKIWSQYLHRNFFWFMRLCNTWLQIIITIEL